MADLTAVVTRAAARYLGHDGVVAVYEAVIDGEPVLVFAVTCKADGPPARLPLRFEGVRIVLESAGENIPY